MRYYNYYNFKFCSLGIAEKESAICCVFFNTDCVPEGHKKYESPLICNAASQLEEYFEGTRKEFDLPLTFHGTQFKIKVWEAVLSIPYGETRSYGDIAKMIDNPKASQAVGRTNHTNQIAIIVPCHRVIGHDGSIVGYAGGIELKQKLLDHEKANRCKC